MQPKKKKQKIDEEALLGYSTDDFIKTQLEEFYSGLKHVPKPNPDEMKDHLLSLKSGKKKTIGEAFNFISEKKSVWPLPSYLEIPNGYFKFCPPSQIIEVGGAKSCTQLKSSGASDLLLVLPEKFSEPKDYLNGRYLVKRTLFLMYLIPKLKKLDSVSVIKFRYFNRDVLKPILHVQCKNGDSFNLIPSGCSFKQSLLSPDRNAVRPDKIYDDGIECTEMATPFYNSSVLTDVLSPQYVDFLSVISESESLRKVLTILKFWCSRKSLKISGHVITTIVLHMFKSASITSEMDVLTICKRLWSYLSTDFIPEFSSGIIVGNSTKKSGYPGLYVDTTANVAYNTDPVALAELSRHSRVMLEQLESRDYNTVLSVMTERVSSLFDVCDVVYRVNIPEALYAEDSLQYCGVKFRGTIDHIKSILQKSYGDRVMQTKIDYTIEEPWSRISAPVLPTSIMIGLSIEKDNCNRVVERGPSADTPESKTFKEFWGEKSSLRRFQDGSIVQAVVWQGRTAQERRSILTQITEHILNRHLGITADRIEELKFDSGKIVGQSHYEGDGEEQAQKIIKTFSDLSKILRSCSKIPLSITSVLGISPVLRNTDLYPQAEYQVSRARKQVDLSPEMVPPYVKAHDIVCHFELSGKWPEDVRGILRLKAAFYLALKEELESLHITAKVNYDFIDIARNGFVFRLRFYVPKEEKMRASNISFWVPSSAADLKVETVILPYVSSYLGSLALQQKAFPLTVRFLKRWVAEHCLSNYIPDIFCELVVAHIFLSSKSYSVPQTATAAFLRVLSFLSSFDWALYPLLINFNEELSSETVELFNNFMNTRKSYPDACVVCPQNEKSELTRTAPTKSSLNILKHLAKNSISDISTLFSVFQPKPTSYNVIIHLKKSKTGRFPDSKPHQHHAKSIQFPVTEFEPARMYVEELTQAYGYLCLFLYNRYNPTEVGVVMKNAGNEHIKFTVNGSMGKVRTDDGKVKHNLDAMLSDFDLLGKGLVQNIEVVNLQI